MNWRRVNWSRVIGNIGRTLIGSGTLILLFVVYQLWGTALHEKRAQSNLTSEFATALEDRFGLEVDQISLAARNLPATLDAQAVVQAASVTDESEDNRETGDAEAVDIVDTSFLPAGLLSDEYGAPPPPAEDGDAVAQIRIPRIGVTKTVVEGVTTDALKAGPGHYPGTPLPGQAGNAAIAGHRTTYGAPFYSVDELEENDLIYVTTLQGSFIYRVVDQLIVSPSDVYVLDASSDNRLTLTTCHPRLSARQRLVIVAELIGEPAEGDPSQLAAPGQLELPTENFDEPTASSSTTSTTEQELGDDIAVAAPITTTTGQTTTTAAEVAAPPVFTEVSHGGIDGEPVDRLPVLFWGLFAASVAFGIWYLAERWRKVLSYSLGAPVFLLVLFIFFEEFSALLPPGV